MLQGPGALTTLALLTPYPCAAPHKLTHCNPQEMGGCVGGERLLHAQVFERAFRDRAGCTHGFRNVIQKHSKLPHSSMESLKLCTTLSSEINFSGWQKLIDF